MQNFQKKSNFLTVMLVTNDKTSPAQFKISFTLLKILLGCCGVLIIFFVFGITNYWRMLIHTSDYDSMNAKLIEVQKNETKLNRIFQDFKIMQETNYRLRRSLGANLELSPIPKPTEEKVIKNQSIIAQNSREDFSSLRTFDYSMENNITMKDSPESFPFHLPVEGFISRDFEVFDPVKGNMHNGIDIVAAEGSIIRAVANGVVILANWTPQSGYMIIINHLNGYLSFYKHNKRLLVREKEFIKKGDAICLMGNSGQLTTGPHLHFELWKNGQPINPKSYLGFS